MQEEEALRGAYIQRGPRSERKTNDICYHMLRILKVILEGHPCSMLPYPRMSPFHLSSYFEELESRRSQH